jgi:hypothetical protein
MQMRFLATVSTVIVLLAAHSTGAKQVKLLDGQLSFVSPVDISQTHTRATGTDRYSVLCDLASADGTFSLCVTYGKHTLKNPDMQNFLEQKVASYSRLNAKTPHFQWIQHRIVERNGRRWAEICFSHDNASGAPVYTRCLSCFVQGHLLEIWAITRRAVDSKQKSYVDHVIDSVRLTS